MVDGRAPGLSTEPLPMMGMPGWKLGAPRFEDVEVPHENLLGREGDGFKLAMMTFDRSRPTVAAQAVCVGQGAIDLALDYAARRETMGEPSPGWRWARTPENAEGAAPPGRPLQPADVALRA